MMADSEYLYHITEREHIDSICTNGIKATDYLNEFADMSISLSLESLRQCEEKIEKRAFAEALFEELRPPEFPSRGSATYYYASPLRAAYEAKISPKEIAVVRVVTESVEQPFVAGLEMWSAYPIVRTLMLSEDSTPTLELGHLRDAIDFYWTEAQIWEGTIHPQWEVYYPEPMPANCIDDIFTPDELWGQGGQ